LQEKNNTVVKIKNRKMELLKKVQMFLENPLIATIGLLASILTIVSFFKKPKVIKETIIREREK